MDDQALLQISLRLPSPDPVEFRLRHLEDERARAVLRAAAAKADWGTGKEPDGADRGRGVAFARYKNGQCYVAVIVELSVNRDSGQINLEWATIAADAGQIGTPDGLSNQLEGGFVQAASWTLKEKMNFDAYGLISVNWDTHPILRFSEAPIVEPVLLNRPGQPYLVQFHRTHIDFLQQNRLA